MAAPTRTDITLAGSANANQPARLVLTAATDWAWPADLGTDCLNCYIEHNGTRIKHWFEDTRRARASVWLNSPNPIVAGDTLTLVSGVSRPRTKPTPESVGLVAGFNGADWRSIGVERGTLRIVSPNTTPTNAPEATFWNMVPRVWRMASGNLGMVCMGGAATELAATKYVVFAQSTDEGRSWSTPKLLVANPGAADYAHASAAFTHDGKDYVVLSTGEDFEPKTDFFITESDDDGSTWGTPAAITGLPIAGTGGNNTGIQLSAKWGNKWAFTSHLLDTVFVCHLNVCDPAVDVTEWTQYVMCDDTSFHPQEPGIVELDNGQLMAIIRTNTGNAYASRTAVVGAFDSWEPFQPIDLPNSNSKPDLIKLSDGRLAHTSCWNGVFANRSAGTRRELTLAISSDEGQTWPTLITVDNVLMHSAQYPSAIELTDGSILVTYAGLDSAASITSRYRTIFCQKIPVSEIRNPASLYAFAGGGGHRAAGSFRKQLSNEALSTRSVMTAIPEYPLYVSCQVRTMGDYPRTSMLSIFDWASTTTSNGIGGIPIWVMAIGGDNNLNGWEFKINPYKNSFLTTGKAATVGGEHSLEVFIENDEEYYTKINTTRVPSGTTMKAFHDTGALPRQIAIGAPGYGDFPDPRGAAMAGGSYQEYICAVVCHDPAFLTGALD